MNAHRPDRRTLLLAGGGLATGFPLAAAGQVQAAGPAERSATTGLTTRSPLVEQRADPFITRPVEGMYYLTGSVPAYDRIVVRGATTLDGLAQARERTIWRRPASGRMGGHIWAPELHRIDGRWYVYFAAGDADDVFRVRMYVLESAADDPRENAWQPPRRITTGWDTFSLDATTFEHRGRRYFVWAQSEPGIATNSNLYCIGLLTADARADLIDPASWSKSPRPVFTTNENTRQYGPEHNSFTVAEDGTTDVLVYHARDYRDITGDPLYDPNRHARLQRLHWNENGTPSFGVPVGKGGPVIRLSPMDAPRARVRHYDYRLRVDSDVREVADSQFRIVPGFLGPDRIALRSVNFPDRYVRIVGTQLQLAPYDDSDAYGRSASLVRLPGLADSTGMSLELSDRPGLFVSHDRGRLTVTRPTSRAERERATFRQLDG